MSCQDVMLSATMSFLIRRWRMFMVIMMMMTWLSFYCTFCLKTCNDNNKFSFKLWAFLLSLLVKHGFEFLHRGNGLLWITFLTFLTAETESPPHCNLGLSWLILWWLWVSRLKWVNHTYTIIRVRQGPRYRKQLAQTTGACPHFHSKKQLRVFWHGRI